MKCFIVYYGLSPVLLFTVTNYISLFINFIKYAAF